MPEVHLIDVLNYYKGLPHQKEAIQLLQASMPASLLQSKAAWHQKWIEEPKKAEGGYFTPAMFEELTGFAADKFPQSFCDDCNRLFEDSGFAGNLNAAQMLMANLLHETGGFVWMKEMASGEDYNNRKDLGNGPDDGPRFKGAGVLMLTGRYNYAELAADIDDPRVMEGVDYVAEVYPFSSALTWIQENGLLAIAKRGEFKEVCMKINGGTTGYADRCAKYKICQRVMK